MYLSVELIIIISQLCLSNGESPKAVAESIRCNEQIISCTTNEYRRQFVKDQLGAFNKCYIKYELEK